ncbi:MAG: D-2-hydroxyacid dehydrogenase [Caldilineaceae bacterium]|nr:D-2-hydroxyacid dehydrogenase [Caldilineaceae bacterium]
MKTILLGFAEEQLPAAVLAQIQAFAPDYRLLQTTERDVIMAALDEIEIAVNRFPTDLILQAPQLRWLQQWGAGVDWLLRYPAVAALDHLTITTGSGVHAVPITEHIFGFLLAFGRGLHTAVRRQLRQEWQSPTWPQLFELPGKTMLLIGVGAIGERTAAIATALGMRVIGIRREPTLAVPGVAAMHPPSDLLRLLPQADVVVLTVPLTTETHHLLGERELRAMKPSAYLINIGRGATIDEPALVRALQEGWIAGAGLDVCEVEPLPLTSPLWRLENVILTAHYAGATPHYDERALPIFLDNLKRYGAGEPLHNVVHKQSGY